MSKVLPFSRLGGSPPPASSELKFYELQDNALSVDGLHPRAGDLCGVREGVEALGKPHMARTRGGQLLCGILQTSGLRGKLVTLNFPNPDFPPFTRHRDHLRIIGVVARFYCAAEGDLETGLTFTQESHAIRVQESEPRDLPLRVEERTDVPLERVINWRSDAEGNIELVSPHWLAIINKPFEFFKNKGYLNLLRPSDRDAVREQWLRSLETGEPFAFQRQLKTRHGYRLARCMAVRVRNPLTGEPAWVGTLHVLEEI